MDTELKILITGGSGYLGSHITRYLVQYNPKNIVHILTRQKEIPTRLVHFKNNIKLIENPTIKYDVIFHCATVYGRNEESETEIKACNISLGLDLIRVATTPNTLFINMGTSLPDNVSYYAQTKNEFINLIKDKPLRLINLKLEQFYGKDDGTLVSFVINSLKNNQTELKMTLGEQKRDFIFIEDLIEAIGKIYGHHLNLNFNYIEFEIGSGKAYSIKEVVTTIEAKVHDHKTKILWGAIPYRKNEVMNSCANISKLTALGWSPHFDLKSGISKILSS